MGEVVYELDNISDYILDITGDKLIIMRNLIEITESNYKSFDFKHSVILECKINNNSVSKLKYKPIISELWEYLNSKDKDFKIHTTMNYEEGSRNTNGFNYITKLNMSVQGKDAFGSFCEIFKLVNVFDIDFYIKLKLSNNKVVYFENISKNINND